MINGNGNSTLPHSRLWLARILNPAVDADSTTSGISNDPKPTAPSARRLAAACATPNPFRPLTPPSRPSPASEQWKESARSLPCARCYTSSPPRRTSSSTSPRNLDADPPSSTPQWTPAPSRIMATLAPRLTSTPPTTRTLHDDDAEYTPEDGRRFPAMRAVYGADAEAHASAADGRRPWRLNAGPLRAAFGAAMDGVEAGAIGVGEDVEDERGSSGSSPPLPPRH
ncbi:hypothetical protein DFH09DRAFT_1280345 [Mycena vulgaris]|nr:hypothetical protein DFH09DRAFT_1280345 [Mycena vulgaris]